MRSLRVRHSTGSFSRWPWLKLADTHSRKGIDYIAWEYGGSSDWRIGDWKRWVIAVHSHTSVTTTHLIQSHKLSISTTNLVLITGFQWIMSFWALIPKSMNSLLLR